MFRAPQPNFQGDKRTDMVTYYDSSRTKKTPHPTKITEHLTIQFFKKKKNNNDNTPLFFLRMNPSFISFQGLHVKIH